MTKTRLTIGLLTFFSFAAIQSCGGDDDPSPGFQIKIENQFVNLPSNVSIFFQVQDQSGNGVAGLTEEDFNIYENGGLISEFEAARKIQSNERVFDYNIMLLLDLSGSVLSSQNLAALKSAAKSFIDEVVPMEGGPSAGAIKVEIWWFDGSENIKQLQPITPNTVTLKNTIDNISPNMSSDNSTNLYGAVIQSVTIATQRLNQTRQLDEIGSNAVVIFTDGTDQANRASKGQALEAVSKADPDIAFYTIGLGGEIDQTVLRSIGKTSFVSASNIGELLDRFKEIGDLINGRANSFYLLEYCSPKRSGNNQLTIEVVKGSIKGRANTLFDASDFNGSCNLQQN
uniref:vWA domain-containing protein n=1 Tax=Roseivirga sp. TaxID=1964215 RepID=UPI00404733B0